MSKKVFYACLTLLLFQLSVISKTLYAGDNDELKLIGISYMPAAKWGYDTEGGGPLNVKLDSNSFITYEGEMWFKSGFKFGVVADADKNIIGKVRRVLGFIGYENFSIRASGGNITGTAEWDGEGVPGQPKSTKINTKYRSTDLIWGPNFGPSYGRVFYIAISYTEYTMPVLMEWDYSSPRYVYDDNAKFKGYGLTFGGDTMYYTLNSRTAVRDSCCWLGFDPWVYYECPVLIGKMNISDEGVRRMREIVPDGEVVKDKQKYWFNGLQIDAILGLMRRIELGSTAIAIGVGYNFSFRYVIPSRGDGVSIPAPTLFRSGYIFRVISSF